MIRKIKKYLQIIYSFFFVEIKYIKNNNNSFIEYNNNFVLNNFLSKREDIKNLKIFEKDGFYFNKPNINPVIFFALSQIHKKEIKVLDFGGGVGSIFFNNKSFFKEKVSWSIFEKREICELLKNSNFDINFFHDIEFIIKKDFDMVIFSSSLQYIENYSKILSSIIDNINPNIFMILKTPFTNRFDDMTVIQQNKHLNSNYSSHLFSLAKFKNYFKNFGYNCIYSNISNETSKYHFYKSTKVEFMDLFFKRY